MRHHVRGHIHLLARDRWRIARRQEGLQAAEGERVQHDAELWCGASGARGGEAFGELRNHFATLLVIGGVAPDIERLNASHLHCGNSGIELLAAGATEVDAADVVAGLCGVACRGLANPARGAEHEGPSLHALLSHLDLLRLSLARAHSALSLAVG